MTKNGVLLVMAALLTLAAGAWADQAENQFLSCDIQRSRAFYEQFAAAGPIKGENSPYAALRNSASFTIEDAKAWCGNDRAALEYAVWNGNSGGPCCFILTGRGGTRNSA